MDKLEQRYILENKAEIYEYIRCNPDLVDLLQAIGDEFVEVFGEDTPIVLKKYDDFEFDETKLIAYIYSSFSAEETLEKIIELTEQRFSKYRRLIDGRFMFDAR